MRDLSDRDVIDIWERGQSRHPIDRALTMLAVAGPQDSVERLAALSIGERDARLIDAYTALFGSTVTAAACCERCQEDLEFTFGVDEVRAVPRRSAESAYALRVGSFSVEFRVPNSLDLADIASRSAKLASLADARARLVARCVLRALDDGRPIEASELPPAVVDALAAEMQSRDPQADVTLTTTCPQCGHTWALCFDIVTFLWTRIALRARQLLRDVHQLARAYGWREADVLALGSVRRRAYLELLS